MPPLRADIAPGPPGQEEWVASSARNVSVLALSCSALMFSQGVLGAPDARRTDTQFDDGHISSETTTFKSRRDRHVKCLS